MTGRCSLSTLVAMAALLTNRAGAQPPPGRAVSKSGVPVGGQELFALDLSNTPLGEIPGTLKLLSGNVEVVLKGGVRMLKAPTASSFLITLPQVLPQDFTLEFDLIPKVGGPPPDLTVEGTPTINQGPGSAHLLWQADGYLAVIGGAQDNYEQPMPEDFRAGLPGVLTQVGVSVEGTTVKLYTNGRRLYTLERQFARGRVLRVSLGGASDANAVYLAGLRIMSGAFPPAAIAGIPSPPPGRLQSPGEKSPPPPPSPNNSSTLPSAVEGISVTIGAQGPIVDWAQLSIPASYSVRRWKSTSPSCCSNLSPTGLNGPPWQDTPLPSAGTYVYEVTATFAGGTATGRAQFTNITQVGGAIQSIASSQAASAPGAASPPAVTSSVPGNSPIKYFLPPPSRIIGLNSITGAGGSPPVSSQTIVLSLLSSAGAFALVTPRTLMLPAITATGPIRTVTRTVMGTSTSLSPAPRTITLTAISAGGVSSVTAARTITLSGLTGTGAFPVIAPHILSLAGWTAVGSIP